MHIASSMIGGAICPVTIGVSALGVAGASYLAIKSKDKPSAMKFSAVTAMVFAAQMLNFSISNGTSGHLIGGVLLAAILGIPFGILSMTTILAVQCFVFADGGITALGANTLNMAIIGVGLGGLILKTLLKITKDKKYSASLSIGLSALISVLLASTFCAVEVSMSGIIEFSKISFAMVKVHSVIGIGEALISLAIFMALSNIKSEKRELILTFSLAGIFAVILSPFASSYPDGLEFVASKYGFLKEVPEILSGIIPDYELSAISNSILSVSMAGLMGILISFAGAFSIAKIIKR